MEIKDVENLAELARLELSQEEKEKILADMGNILKYVQEVEQVSASIDRTSLPQYNAWREDVLEKREFSKDLIISEFPDKQGEFLKVKKIL